VLSSGRRVHFSNVDPEAARRLFVEEALVRGQPVLPFPFLERNGQVRARIERAEACLRRRDLLASEDRLARFYLERIPAQVASTSAFERWWRHEEPRRPHLLDAPEDVFLARPLPAIDPGRYPGTVDVHGTALPVRYHYDPTSELDGATIDVPLPLLRVLDAQRLEWLVPGWLREKVVALLRGLPKEVRRGIVPIPDAADRLMALLPAFGDGSLFEHVASFATRETGAEVSAAQVATVPLPPWLHFNFRILDPAGRALRESRELQALREQFRARSSAALREHDSPFLERAGLRTWDFGELADAVPLQSGGLRLTAYPGLQDQGSSVRLKLYMSAAASSEATRGGLMRLAALAVPQQHELVRRQLAADRDFALPVAAAGLGSAVFAEIADRAVAEAILPSAYATETSATAPRTRAEFAELVERGRADVIDRGREVARTVHAVLASLREVRTLQSQLESSVFDPVRAQVDAQLGTLLAPGWIRDTPSPWWEQLPKYVRAVARRLERARGDVERDRRLQAQVEPYERTLRELLATVDADTPRAARGQLRWMLEEFRLSLFAQDLRTVRPVSAKRLDEQVALARKEAGIR
jgi:ATP-dependent helicase HrpA